MPGIFKILKPAMLLKIFVLIFFIILLVYLLIILWALHVKLFDVFPKTADQTYVAYIESVFKNTKQDFDKLLSPFIQIVVSITALFGALFVSINHASKIDKSKKRDDEAKEIIRLSHLMYDKDFYIKIVAPSWEIASKWLYWRGDEGSHYRFMVVSGFFITKDTEDRKFWSIEESNKNLDRNFLRQRHHFSQSQATSELEYSEQLSEHMVLVVWINFWSSLAFLVDRKIVSGECNRGRSPGSGILRFGSSVIQQAAWRCRIPMAWMPFR